MKRKRGARWLSLVAVALLVVPLLAGCARGAPTPAPTPTPATPTPTPPPGPTPVRTPTPPPPAEEVEMGVVSYLRLGDATGPIAALSMPASFGQADLYRYINEVMGGIHYKDPRTGRAERVKVNFVEVDTRYDVARGLSSYRRYQGLPKLMLVDPVSTPMVKAILPLLEQDKVVAYATHDGEFDAHPGWGFLWGPPYQDAFAGALTWITKVDWPKKGLARAPVIGYLTWDSPYGRELLRGSTAFADDYGLKLLPRFRSSNQERRL